MMIDNKRKIIAFENRLRKCNNVLILGVKTNFSDYSEYDKKVISNAKTIYYPSSFYVSLFNSSGKNVFPSWNNYNCAQDKIKQTTLFKLLGLPHPRTRFFYGKEQKIKSSYSRGGRIIPRSGGKRIFYRLSIGPGLLHNL